MASSPVSASSAGVAVAGATGLAVFGPLLGLTLDAYQWQGLGGHLLAESLPGGRARLRRIASHEAGHLLVAQAEALPVLRVLVGTRACLQAGLRSNGA